MKINKEIKVGLVVIAAIIILIWGVNFLKARSLFSRNQYFYGVYDKVDGLKISSSVLYRGYQVGQVSNISFIGDSYNDVLVKFSVTKDLPIPKDSRAKIHSSDIMGTKSIQLIPGESKIFAEDGDTLSTEMQLGMMDQLNKQVAPLKKKAEDIMVSLDTVLVSIKSIFDESERGNLKGNLKSVRRTLDNIEGISKNLNEFLDSETSRLASILSDVNRFTNNIDTNNIYISNALHNFNDFSQKLARIKIDSTMMGLDSIFRNVNSISLKINKGSGFLGQTVNSDELYNNLLETTDNLDKVISDFKRNPKKYVHLSVFDFSSSKFKGKNYGIVIGVFDTALNINDNLYKKNPNLTEYRKNDKYYYMIETFIKLREAEKSLKKVKKCYNDAYIVKLEN